MPENIADIRQEYARTQLLEADIASDAMVQFAKWFEEAQKAEIFEVNSMVLATASADGMPSARVVLLKGFSKNGFAFFTNYNSYKGQQLAENPRACLVFFWKELERQIRVTGMVEKLPPTDSDLYFKSRPLGSQLGAVASPQSQIIESREWLDERYNTLKEKFPDGGVTRPPHWGGYLLKPVIIEFWQGRPGRLHDRIRYTLEGDHWKTERLAP
jgi:pyridoxamine 5'-phosphate oxidase